MATRSIEIKVKEESKWKLTVEQIITIILSIALLFSTVYYAYQSDKLQNQNIQLEQANYELLEKQTNYTIQAFVYPIEALVEGGYVNHSSSSTFGNGFLNATIIVSTPDITRLIIENCSFTPTYSGKILTTSNTYLDYSKINDWVVNFGTDSNLRSQWYIFNNFTYYTSQAGINTIGVSIPVYVTFNMNPLFDFPNDISLPTYHVALGNMTVTASITDMQTNIQQQFTFSTELIANVVIS